MKGLLKLIVILILIWAAVRWGIVIAEGVPPFSAEAFRQVGIALIEDIHKALDLIHSWLEPEEELEGAKEVIPSASFSTGEINETVKGIAIGVIVATVGGVFARVVWRFIRRK